MKERLRSMLPRMDTKISLVSKDLRKPKTRREIANLIEQRTTIRRLVGTRKTGRISLLSLYGKTSFQKLSENVGSRTRLVTIVDYLAIRIVIVQRKSRLYMTRK